MRFLSVITFHSLMKTQHPTALESSCVKREMFVGSRATYTFLGSTDIAIERKHDGSYCSFRIKAIHHFWSLDNTAFVQSQRAKARMSGLALGDSYFVSLCEKKKKFKKERDSAIIQATSKAMVSKPTCLWTTQGSC